MSSLTSDLENIEKHLRRSIIYISVIIKQLQHSCTKNGQKNQLNILENSKCLLEKAVTDNKLHCCHLKSHLILFVFL